MNDYTYQVLDPKDVYIDNGVGQTIGYMQPSTTTSVSTSSSPSTSTTVTTSAGTIPSQYMYATKKGFYTLGKEQNFTEAWRSGLNTLIKKIEPDEDMLERMIDSLYA